MTVLPAPLTTTAINRSLFVNYLAVAVFVVIFMYLYAFVFEVRRSREWWVVPGG